MEDQKGDSVSAEPTPPHGSAGGQNTKKTSWQRWRIAFDLLLALGVFSALLFLGRLDGRFDCSKDQAELEGAKANIKTVEAKLTAATKENEKMIESANNVQNSLRDEIDRLHNVIADKDRQIEGLLTTRCATEQQRYDNAQRAYQNSVPSLLVCDYESAGGQCRRREGEPFLADAVQRAQAILTACLSAQSR